MAKNNLIDSDFDDFDDLKQPDFGEDVEHHPNKKEDKSDLEIEVVDDAPEQDRGRKTADDLGSALDTEDDVAQYGKKVRDRIAKETAKVHAERRAKEDRERQLSELVEASKRIIAENNQLKGLIENGEKVLISESAGRVKGQLEAAKAAYREAHEAGDVQGILAAQENLAKAVAEQDRLSTHRPQPLPRVDEAELSRYTAPVQQVGPDQAALDWQSKNKWFGRDEAMTAFAMGLHSQLVNREGIRPSDGDEYYERINTEMRKRFPERFGNSSPRRTDTTVAPAIRNDGTGGSRRKVTLTESQVRLARRLGLTPQQYAEQLVAENGQKEWTHG